MGGGAASSRSRAGTAPAETPPTPDPTPPRARARGWRGVHERCLLVRDEFYFRFIFQTADVRPHSRGTMCPSFAWLSLETRGSRECRMRAAPAVSCAKMCERKRTRAYRFSGGTPAFPAQWLYGLLRALPGESGFVVSVVCKQLAHPRPVGPTCLFADLTPTAEASGPHDFTVRFSIARQHVL